MIKAGDVIIYSRTNRTSDTWQVDYSVNYQAALDKSKLPLPCFFIELNNSNAVSMSKGGDFLQQFTTTIRINLICLTKDDNRMGMTGADLVYYARRELFRIFLNRKIDGRYDAIYFVGDSFQGYDEARYIHSFEFAFTGLLDWQDTVTPNYDDLKAIHVDYEIIESAESEKPNAKIIVNTLHD